MDYKAYPDMRRLILACSSVYEAGGSEAVAALKSHPMSFTAVALAEVLSRWQRRGIPCAETHNPVRPPKELFDERMNLW